MGGEGSPNFTIPPAIPPRFLSLVLLLVLLPCPSRTSRSPTGPPLLLLLDRLDTAKHSAANARLRAETQGLLSELLSAKPPPSSSVHPLYNCRTPDMFCEKEGDPDHLVPCEETAYMNECLESCRNGLKDCATTYAAVLGLKPITTHNFMRMFLSPKNITAGPDVESPPPPPPPKPLPQELRKKPPHLEEKKPIAETTEELPTDAEDVDVALSGSIKNVPDRNDRKDRKNEASMDGMLQEPSPAQVLERARKKDRVQESLARLGITSRRDENDVKQE